MPSLACSDSCSYGLKVYPFRDVIVSLEVSSSSSEDQDARL